MFLLFHRELWHKERESLLKLAEITKEGFKLKQQLIQEAMRGVDDRKVGCTGKNWLFVLREIYISNTTLIRFCLTPFIHCPTGLDLTILIYFDRLNLKKFAQARVIWRRRWRLCEQWKRPPSSRREKLRSAIWRLGRVSENVILYHHLVSPGVLHFRWMKSLGLFLLHFGLNNVQTLPELLSHLK